MNPVQVFFIISIFLNDMIFNSCQLSKIMIYLTITYWIITLIFPKSTFHSASRKLMISCFSQSYDPTIYAKVNVDISPTLKFIDEYEKKNGIKLSIPLIFSKALSESTRTIPGANLTIKNGKASERGSNDISVLVDLGGKDLSFVTLRDMPDKSFKSLYDEMYSKVKNIKKGEDEDYKKQYEIQKILPSYIIGISLEVVGWISNLGASIKALSIRKNNFGTFVVTSVGGLKIEDVYAPLLSLSNTCGVITLSTIKNKKIVNADGTVSEVKILPVLNALDHRYIDGALAAKIMKKTYECLQNPELIKNI